MIYQSSRGQQARDERLRKLPLRTPKDAFALPSLGWAFCMIVLFVCGGMFAGWW